MRDKFWLWVLKWAILALDRDGRLTAAFFRKSDTIAYRVSVESFYIGKAEINEVIDAEAETKRE